MGALKIMPINPDGDQRTNKSAGRGLRGAYNCEDAAILTADTKSGVL